MNIEIKKITREEFKKHENNFDSHNFLQTADYYDLQNNRKRYSDLEILGFYLDDNIVGVSLVIYRKRYRFFTEAIILHGPLIDYNSMHVKEILDSFKNYLINKGVSNIIVSPYLDENIWDEDLNITSNNIQDTVHNLLIDLGFNKLEDNEVENKYLLKMFRKNINQYANDKELFSSFKTNIQRNIKKYVQRGVKCVETEDTSLVYDILLQSSERKNHDLQDFSFFDNFQKCNNTKYYLAYLDIIEYRNFLSAEIVKLEQEIEKLFKKDAEKFSTRIKNLEDTLSGYKSKYTEIDSYKLENNKLILSALIFVESKSEIVYYLGGNIPEYFEFNGTSVAMWEKMLEAYNNDKKYFNFYGVIEVDKVNENRGNFNFKRRWGGELVELIGVYECSTNFLFKLIKKIKRD